jgi:DNA-binding HxlR family transcriptional regulator
MAKTMEQNLLARQRPIDGDEFIAFSNTALDDSECMPLAVDNSSVYLCSVEQAARIVGQKWTLQIVNVLMDFKECRFCELQDALGGVNPGTLSARLKMLEEEGILLRSMVSAAPPHVTYRLTPMGDELSGVIRELTNWSRSWLCAAQSDGPAVSLERLTA